MSIAASSQGAGTAAPAKFGTFRFSMGAGLVGVILFAVLVSALAVHLPWQYTARQNVEDIARRLNDEIINGVRREVRALFERAEAAQQSIHDIFSAGVVELDEKTRREQLYFAFLRANPHFSWVSFGFPNGDFFGANRRGGGNFRIVESTWDGDKEQATRRIDYYVDYESTAYRTHSKVKQNTYYAPQREWYRRAIQDPGHIWTDVYVFASSRRPGINTAKALSRDGKVVGVISIAMELERFSTYLGELRVGDSGVAFITNARAQVIAFQDQDQVTVPGAADARPTLRHLDATTHPLLRIASAALDASGTPLADLATSRPLRYTDAGTGARYFATFAPVGRGDWIVGTVIPESDFLIRVDENNAKLLYALAAAIALVGLIAIALSRVLFVRPLARIVAQTQRIERFDLDSVKRVRTRIKEIDALSAALERMSLGLASFQKYVPIELVRTLTARGIGAELGGDKRTLSIMFMDLESFTTMTEELGHRLLPHLADYLSDMSGEIIANNGTIDKYIGDAIMAFWGAPISNENHATDACRAALRCLRLLEIRRVDWAKQGRPEFRVRIGINTGRVIVGNIGSNERLDYTVLGDPVNLAARLETLSKDYGTRLLIGQHTYDLAKYDIFARRLDTVAVKGKTEQVNIYEVLAMRDEVGPNPDFGWFQAYERGLELMRGGRWDQAIACFTQTIEMRGGFDKPSTVMTARCREALEAGGPRPAQETEPARRQRTVEETLARHVGRG